MNMGDAASRPVAGRITILAGAQGQVGGELLHAQALQAADSDRRVGRLQRHAQAGAGVLQEGGGEHLIGLARAVTGAIRV